MMRIKVKFFATHRELTGKNEVFVELKKGHTLNDAIDHLYSLYPSLRELKEETIVSLNHTFTPMNQKLKKGDEIALFPPVSGG